MAVVSEIKSVAYLDLIVEDNQGDLMGLVQYKSGREVYQRVRGLRFIIVWMWS